MFKKENKYQKLLFCINSLSTKGGGAEKILSIILNKLILKGYKIELITFDKNKKKFFYDFSNKIKIHRLGNNILFTNKFLIHLNRIIILFFYLIKIKPKIAFGFMHSSYIDITFASIFLNLKVVACEHIIVDHFKNRKFELFLINFVSLFIYKITVVTKQVKNKFSNFLQRKMTVIDNIIDRSDYFKKTKFKRKKIILSVGRMADQKNFFTLIKAFKIFQNENRNWKLLIVGDGFGKKLLLNQIKSLKLDKSVKILNFTKELKKLYCTSSLYVSSSVYESLGLTVAEALIQKLPCIAFSECDGVNKLIKHDKNGLLIKGNMYNPKRLANSMIDLAKNKKKLLEMSNYHDPKFLLKNSKKVVLKKWIKLINEMS